MMAIGEYGKTMVRLASNCARSSRLFFACCDRRGFIRIGLGNWIQMLLFQGTGTTSAVTTSTTVFIGIFRMGTGPLGVCLLSTVAFDVRRTRLAKSATMSALSYWSPLLVNMGQRSVRMLTIANTMTSHTRLTRILLAFDQHICCRITGTADRKTAARLTRTRK